MALEYVDFHEQGNFRRAASKILEAHLKGTTFREMKAHFDAAAVPGCSQELTTAFLAAFEDRVNQDQGFRDRIELYETTLEKYADESTRPGLFKRAAERLKGADPSSQQRGIITDFLQRFHVKSEDYGIKFEFAPLG